MVVKSTENIRALTTKLVKVAQERTSSVQQKSASPAGVGAAGSAKLAVLGSSDDGAKSAPAAAAEEGRVDGGTGGGEPGGVEGNKGSGPPSKAVSEGEGGGKQGSPSRGGVINSNKSTRKKNRR